MSNIEKFIVKNDEEQPKNVLLIDGGNLFMRCLFSVPYDPLDPTYIAYKTTLFMSIKKTLKQFRPDKVIFCLEGRSNWRKQIYSEYKKQRRDIRDKSVIDFDSFFMENGKLIEDLIKVVKNIQFLQVDNCEADDLIGVIVKNKSNWKIINQSSDSDFYQLFKYPNYNQWNAKKKQFAQVLNPESYLTEKIILGDVSDNIPRLSALKFRQGPKYVQKNVLTDLNKWIIENNMEKEWARNQTLISFDAIPTTLSETIMKNVNEWKPEALDERGLYYLFNDHKLFGLISDITEFVNIFKNIKSKD